ncbi:MAG: AAA family ATPase [candidate division KSB1 bacterium]|jgi:dephospho-CoA kinase|nr:AAA family ATPase [candidate division KSB1 bacterium]
MKLGLTGTNASGKTSIVNYLTSRRFRYYSLSDVIRDELSKRGLEHSRDNLRRVGNELRSKFGPSALADKIIDDLCDGNAVIDSIRNVSEVESLRHLPEFRLISIDAPIEIRYIRAKGRGRVENADSIEDFQAAEDKEKSRNRIAQNIDQCMALADYTIFNDGDLTTLQAKIDKIIKEIEKNETKLG